MDSENQSLQDIIIDVNQSTRALARLRAHGIIKKVSGRYRYQLTRQGRQIVTALIAARQADVEKLVALAA